MTCLALTIPEAAELLGVHPETVARQLRAGQLPGVKVGTVWRIPRRALVNFLEGR